MNDLIRFTVITTIIYVTTIPSYASVCSNDYISNIINESFREMKPLFHEMQKKLAYVVEKVNQTQHSDYALEVGHIDKSLNAFNSNLYQKLKDIESGIGSLEKIMESNRRAASFSGNLQKSIINPNSLEEANFATLIDKLDGYGKKILKAQQALIDSNEKLENNFNDLQNLIPIGFTKILDNLGHDLNDSPAFINTVENVRNILKQSNALNEETAEIKVLLQNMDEMLSLGERRKGDIIDRKTKERMQDIYPSFNKSYANTLQLLDSAFNLSTELKNSMTLNTTISKEIKNSISNLTSLLSEAKETNIPILIIFPENQKGLKELLGTVSILLGSQGNHSVSEEMISKKTTDSFFQVPKADNKSCEDMKDKLEAMLTELKEIKQMKGDIDYLKDNHNNKGILKKLHKSSENFKSLGEIMG